MKKLITLILLFVLIGFSWSVDIDAMSPPDYNDVEMAYFIEPMFPNDLPIEIEAITITHDEESSQLSIWNTMDGTQPALLYNNTLTIQNDGPVRDIDICIPYYNNYRTNLYDLIYLKVNNVKQNPVVSYGNMMGINPSYADYEALRQSSYDAVLSIDESIGYLYEFSVIDSDLKAYVEFDYFINSNRLLTSHDIHQVNWNYSGVYGMSYDIKEENTTLLSMDRTMSFTKEENITYVVNPITLRDFFDLLFTDTTDYDNAEGLVKMIMDRMITGNFYYTYQQLRQIVTTYQQLMFYTYHLSLPTGESSINITYQFPYRMPTANYGGIYATLVTTSNQFGNQIQSYNASYTIKSPFNYFTSDDFEEIVNSPGVYSTTNSTFPTHNITFLSALTDEEDTNQTPDSDPFLILVMIGMIMVPLLIFLAIIAIIFIVVVRKRKPKAY